jgi:hypothetical protein
MTCKREKDESGDWICHRCKCLWFDRLAQTGWLPLKCLERASVVSSQQGKTP